MKCEQCGNPATVHEVKITGGKRVERHLCESCARAEGIPVQGQFNVPEILGKILAQHQQAAETAGAPTAGAAGGGAKPVSIDPTKIKCPTCGTTYGQFRHSGLLGCADCYAAFEVPLGPLLQRAHEGGTHHVGKRPRILAAGIGADEPAAPAPPLPKRKSASRGEASPAEAAAAERARRIEVTRKQLNAAIAAEEYETAAKLRDELRRLEAEAGGASAGRGEGG